MKFQVARRLSEGVGSWLRYEWWTVVAGEREPGVIAVGLWHEDRKSESR
jgi:hypothetical protein